jgi:hypothetical protein
MMYATKSICSCGDSVLRDDISLGRIYEVRPDSRDWMVYQCGACGVHRPVEVIDVRDDASGQFRPLPFGIFAPVAS